MTIRDIILTAVAGLALAVGQAGAGPVAILGAPFVLDGNDDVQAKILGSGVPLGLVDVYSVASSTPSLATLQNYSAVLVYTDTLFAQTTALGNLLADYVDSGGGVVEMTFANASIPLGGRWASGSQAILPPGWAMGQTDGHATLGTVLAPSHPLFNGVTSFGGGSSSYRSTGGVAPGATPLANWSSGEVFAAELDKFNGKILSLNFYPLSSTERSDLWLASTDGGLLMANALAYVGMQVAAVPEPSTLAMGTIASLLVGAGLDWRRWRWAV